MGRFRGQRLGLSGLTSMGAHGVLVLGFLVATFTHHPRQLGRSPYEATGVIHDALDVQLMERAEAAPQLALSAGERAPVARTPLVAARGRTVRRQRPLAALSHIRLP